MQNQESIENIVVKSDRVVSFATPGGSITSSLYKCMNAVILALQNDVRQRFDNFDDVEEVYSDRVYDIQLPVIKFIEYMEWKSNNRQGARRAISLLKDLRVEWDVLESQDGKGNKVGGASIGFQNYVSRAEINDGILSIRLDPDIRRTLLNTSEATSLGVDLRIANGAWSDKYTPILYEHCLLFIRDGQRRFELTVPMFREIMNVPYTIENGEKVWTYPNFKDLRKYVIQKAINNINSLEFLDFRVEAAYVGKPIRIISFFIRNKIPSYAETPEYKNLKQDALMLLDERCLEATCRVFFNKLENSELYFDEEISVKHLHYIKFNIELYDKYATTKKKPLDYFKTCLNNNFDAFENEWIKIQNEMKLLQAKESQRKRVLAAKQREQLEKIEADAIRNYKKEVADAYLNSLSDLEKDSFFREVNEYAIRKNPMIKPKTPGYDALLRIYLFEVRSPELLDPKKLEKRVADAQDEFWSTIEKD
ncbi:replication initiation protein [Catenovulum sp. 2E275]|uniref:replication initiation protein n=1 Tax=Catenovulum sp. 2E275 TaxID=2980497 RepID=UPI0021D2A4C7|nr:replication initiation protein [Catenovulum sp. 2E275]MCU4675592.1 replication initiation protein [Catenovulum sp. 2E275]